MAEFRFPKKSVLVLGQEQEGVPPDALQWVDHCVEIPQLGTIRSLYGLFLLILGFYVFSFALMSYFKILFSSAFACPYPFFHFVSCSVVTVVVNTFLRT